MSHRFPVIHPRIDSGRTSKDVKCQLSEAKKYWCRPSKGYIDQTVTHSYAHTQSKPTGRTGRSCCSWCRWLARRHRNCQGQVSAWWTLSHSSGPAREKRRKRMNIKNINKSAAAAVVPSQLDWSCAWKEILRWVVKAINIVPNANAVWEEKDERKTEDRRAEEEGQIWICVGKGGWEESSKIMQSNFLPFTH